MTSMKSPLKSTLLSPTSSKLMTQYIVKTNLNHHYNKLQNAKACIDNSLPDSILKSQKVRDRKKQESRPNSSKSSQRVKSRQSSRPQSQCHGNTEEHWRGKYDEDLEAEVERIVQMTLNGRSQDLQQVPLHTQNMQNYAKRTDAAYEDTAQSHSRGTQLLSTSHLSISTQSIVSNSERPGSEQRFRTSTRRENQDLLSTNAHLFTEPSKQFVPKILKSNRTSLLNQYKYYNSPKKQKQRQSHGDLIPSSLTSDSRDGGKGEAPVAKPRQNAKLGNTQTLSPSSKMHLKYPKEKEERVPPLDLPADDDDQKESLPEHMTSPKKSTSDRVNLSESQSVMDLPRSPVTLSKSQSLTTQDSESRDEVKYGLVHQIAPENPRKKRHINLNSERSTRLILQPKGKESDYTVFMKEVTEEILMKGIYTNRSIQRVFDSHMRKRKGQLNEDEMRKMLTKLQKDLGIAQSDFKESSKPRVTPRSASAKAPDHASPQAVQAGNAQEQDRDPLSTLMLKEYEEKLIEDESSVDACDVQGSKDTDVIFASNEDKKQEVEQFEVRNNSKNSENNNEGGSLVEENKGEISESRGNSARKPVPQPRRRNSAVLAGSVATSDLSSITRDVGKKSDFTGCNAIKKSFSESGPPNKIVFQDSVISNKSESGLAKESSKISECSSADLGKSASSFDSKTNLTETKTGSAKSEGLVNPSTSLKAKQIPQVKTTEEDNYDDEDFEDDDGDVSDSDF